MQSLVDQASRLLPSPEAFSLGAPCPHRLFSLIGVGTRPCQRARPSLQTVRADFPHTAFRLSSPPMRLPVRRAGLRQRKQPARREEGIGPPSDPPRWRHCSMRSVHTQRSVDHNGSTSPGGTANLGTSAGFFIVFDPFRIRFPAALPSTGFHQLPWYYGGSDCCRVDFRHRLVPAALSIPRTSSSRRPVANHQQTSLRPLDRQPLGF